MAIIFLSTILGIALGIFAPVIPYEFARYTAIAILAALDSIMGGVNGEIKGNFNLSIFVTGFFANIIIAILLTLLGDSLDANIFMAAIFVFVTRIFTNFSSIRRELIAKREKKKTEAENAK